MGASHKDILDTVNSISWLLMDAFWMMRFFDLAYLMVIPTLLSGIIILFMERSLSGVFISLSVVSWSLMNSIWLLAETENLPEYLIYAKYSFAIGILCLLLGMIFSNRPLLTLSRFSRGSIKSFKD